jgi:hypothetical protein
MDHINTREKIRDYQNKKEEKINKKDEKNEELF